MVRADGPKRVARKREDPPDNLRNDRERFPEPRSKRRAPSFRRGGSRGNYSVLDKCSRDKEPTRKRDEPNRAQRDRRKVEGTRKKKQKPISDVASASFPLGVHCETVRDGRRYSNAYKNLSFCVRARQHRRGSGRVSRATKNVH